MISTKAILTGLVAVNVLLGAAIGIRLSGTSFEREARAQLGGGPTIQVVGGQLNNRGTIYILNQTTGDLSVVQTDTTRNVYLLIDKVNVIKDLQAIK